MVTRRCLAVLAVLMSWSLAGSRIAAQPIAFVLSGQAAPDGGNYGQFPASGNQIFLPVINSTGRVQFYSFLTGGSSTAGMFVGTPGSITPVALQGQPAPAGGNWTDSFSDNRQNVAGQVAFSCTLSSGGQGLFMGLPGALQTMALDGTASPGGGGNYTSGFSSPSMNANGVVIFTANLTGGTSSRGFFAGTPGNVQPVILQGAPTPAGGTWGPGLTQSTMNDSGQLAINAPITGITATSGIFFGTPGALQTVALQGEAAPAGGNYNIFTRPYINNTGQFAFRAFLTGGTATSGIFMGTPGALQTVALQGGTAPTGATYTGFSNVLFNGQSKVVFQASLSNDPNAAGLFIGTPGSVETIVLIGNAAPGGGSFLNFNFAPQLNGAGQIAFRATLTGAGVNTTNDVGLYVGVPGQLRKVVREGDQVDVDPGAGVDLRIVNGIGFRGQLNDIPSGGQDSLGVTFTDNGFLTYTLTFTDGSSGIFYSVMAIPEPTTLAAMGLVAVLGGLAWSRRGLREAEVERENNCKE
jgi:hypothetical protein